MNLNANKVDGADLPITVNRIAASEWNQLVASCMAFIHAAGLTPDSSDAQQLLNAFKIIASNLELIGANTSLSNLTAQGEAHFDTKLNAKAGTDLTNITTDGKKAAVRWMIPNYSAGITLVSGTTIPANGWVWIDGYFTAAGGQVVNCSVNGSGFQFGYNASSTYNFDYHTLIPVQEGDVWTCDRQCVFYPTRSS